MPEVLDAPVAPPVAPPASAVVEPFYKDWLSADGTLNAKSYDRLPEDIRYLGPSLSKAKTAEDLMRTFAYNMSAAGKKGLIPLPANAPAEVVAERKAMLDQLNGVPKEAKDYGLTAPKDLPAEAWDQALADNFTKWAHENSISPAAVRKLIDTVQVPTIKASIATQQQAVTDFWAKQDTAFGEAIRKENISADKATAMVDRAATALGFDLTNREHQLALKNATVRMAMVKYAIATGEDAFVSGERTDDAAAGDAFAQAQDIINNKANPLHEPLKDPKHPQHGMVKEKLDQLFRRAALKKR